MDLPEFQGGYVTSHKICVTNVLRAEWTNSYPYRLEHSLKNLPLGWLPQPNDAAPYSENCLDRVHEISTNFVDVRSQVM